MRSITLALLTWGMAICAPAHATDAGGWLSRMIQAEQQRSFDGIFVYGRTDTFFTHQVWQRVDPGGSVRERLLQLDGPVNEAFSINGQVQCLGGALGQQFSKQSHWRGKITDVAEVARYFDLRLVGDARVAGREAVVVAVIPKDQHRYGLELHLDRQTALPLKSLLLDEKGQQLERLQFTQLSLRDLPDSSAVEPSAACVQVSADNTPPAAETQWSLEWLPPGFRLERYSETARVGSDHPLTLLTFIGPLARFSVFLEPLDGAQVDDARSQLGPTVVVSKRISSQAGHTMVTVVGEIPLGTAERVALSMHEKAMRERVMLQQGAGVR